VAEAAVVAAVSIAAAAVVTRPKLHLQRMRFQAAF